MKPTIVTNECLIFVDVDDTLVMWGKAKKGEKVVAITSPYDNGQIFVKPHKGHIKILKDRHARGAHIIVWSAGGYKWAQAVVKALGLESHVNLIMSKPFMYIDDKKAEDFMGEHLYLDYQDKYGA